MVDAIYRVAVERAQVFRPDSIGVSQNLECVSIQAAANRSGNAHHRLVHRRTRRFQIVIVCIRTPPGEGRKARTHWIGTTAGLELMEPDAILQPQNPQRSFLVDSG